ncbi:MAG: acyltransferase [Deltaproteobacteria bacterium]|nr:acyltransferase [Deltaproteobacteria bacterium]
MNKKDLSLAALSGVLLALAFPMFDIELLAWIALVPLLFSINGKNPLQSIYLGITAGLVFNLILLYWIPVPITIYGKLPLPAGIVLLLLLASYLSLYTATLAFLVTFFRTRMGIPLVLSAPVVWVSLELLITYFLTGFPWGVLGYSQYLNLPVIQIADVTGVYGISFLIVVVNAGIYRVIERYMEGLSFRHGRSIWVALFVLLTAIGYGYWRLGSLGIRNPQSAIRIGIVQGNIDQDQKWDTEYQRETVDAYLALSRKVSEGGVDLIIWPETAVPLYFQMDETYKPEILKAAKEMKSYILFGSPAYEKDFDAVRYYNSAFMISPDMKVVGRYDKMHLVPFGEYVPLKKLLFFVDKLAEGIGDFSTGDGIKTLKMSDAEVGTIICYEGIFPNLSRKIVKEGANLFVNITNDAWFGRTSAPFQHLSMYSLRAVENRVPVVRAANTGVSAFIDERGVVTSSTGIFERGYLKAQVYVSGSKSFYTRFGDLFAYVCAIATLVLLTVAVKIVPKGSK